MYNILKITYKILDLYYISFVYLYNNIGKHLNFKTMETLTATTALNLISEEAIIDTIQESNMYDSKPTAHLLNVCIESAICTNQIVFENDSAESLFITCVKRNIKSINRKFYELVYPPVGMTANGTYTTNAKLWA